jgi:release factor glutamine methyltransferase
MSTIGELKKKYFKKIDFFDLEIILAHVLKKSREFVLSHQDFSVNKEQEIRIKNFIIRRINHEPLAYIFGRKEFYGLDFKVNKNVLVPRPETEQIVELTIQKVKNNKQRTKIIDVGTGSGNIIISVACNIKNGTCSKLRYYATDISARALLVAKQNAKLHKVDKKIEFFPGDLLKPIIKNTEYQIPNTSYIITANLPYLDKTWKNLLKSSESKSLKFEPKIALEGGFDGLDAYRRLAGQIKAWKTRNSNFEAIIFCEIGHLQVPEMKLIFSFAKKIIFHKDLSGKWRVCEIKIKKQKSEITEKNKKGIK